MEHLMNPKSNRKQSAAIIPLRRAADVAASLPEFATVDGKRVLIEGQDEIVFRCGKASITLRRNGKVVIRGTRIESVSRGLQRVLGAAVEIN
jgi:hypothetical protein